MTPMAISSPRSLSPTEPQTVPHRSPQTGRHHAAIRVSENSTAVTTVTATDPDAGATLTYSTDHGIVDFQRNGLGPFSFLRPLVVKLFQTLVMLQLFGGNLAEHGLADRILVRSALSL